MTIENDFLDDKECRFVVSIGSKGSGKTTMLLNYIKRNYNKFTEFHLVLPQYKHANNGDQYRFLKGVLFMFKRCG